MLIKGKTDKGALLMCADVPLCACLHAGLDGDGWVQACMHACMHVRSSLPARNCGASSKFDRRQRCT